LISILVGFLINGYLTPNMENDHRADNTIGYELQIGRNELNFCVLPAREPQRVKPV